jgi:hypothetical protein
MITRRSFLAALACLPVAGKFIPRSNPYDAFITRHTVFPPHPDTINWTPIQGLQFHKNAFEFTMRPLLCETRPQLTFVEWDRKFQS